MKVKRLEWEIGKLAREPILFIAREDVRTVAKTLRQAVGRSEQIGLRRG
jgi:hypothetical protein